MEYLRAGSVVFDWPNKAIHTFNVNHNFIDLRVNAIYQVEELEKLDVKEGLSISPLPVPFPLRQTIGMNEFICNIRDTEEFPYIINHFKDILSIEKQQIYLQVKLADSKLGIKNYLINSIKERYTEICKKECHPDSKIIFYLQRFSTGGFFIPSLFETPMVMDDMLQHQQNFWFQKGFSVESYTPFESGQCLLRYTDKAEVDVILQVLNFISYVKLGPSTFKLIKKDSHCFLAIDEDGKARIILNLDGSFLEVDTYEKEETLRNFIIRTRHKTYR